MALSPLIKYSKVIRAVLRVAMDDSMNGFRDILDHIYMLSTNARGVLIVLQCLTSLSDRFRSSVISVIQMHAIELMQDSVGVRHWAMPGITKLTLSLCPVIDRCRAIYPRTRVNGRQGTDYVQSPWTSDQHGYAQVSVHCLRKGSYPWECTLCARPHCRDDFP